MKKAIGLMTLAFVGATLPFTLSAEPMMANAEGEGVSSESVSIASEPLESITEPITESTIEEVGEPQVSEQVEQWIAEFQKTKVYSAIVDAVLIVYTLWGVLDKILTKTNAKKLLENSESANKFSELIGKYSSSLEAKAKEISECYADTKQGLADNAEELKKAVEEFRGSISKVEEVMASFDSVKKALLEMCKNDTELVRNGAYQKILAILNGVKTDE